MADYFDGAIMAYRDCEDFAKNLSSKLPPELQFLKEQFDNLARGFGEKANEVIKVKRHGKN